MPIPAKHAAIIATHNDKNETFITQEEAYYIAGIFNTPVIKTWFDATFSNKSYSIKFGFKLPIYDLNNENAVRIMELSRDCHEITNNKHELMRKEQEIENYYLKLCE